MNTLVLLDWQGLQLPDRFVTCLEMPTLSDVAGRCVLGVQA